jgi:xylose dehydrogenase (NAD/NADP)
MIAGARPTRVQAAAQWTEGGVDRAVAATLQFASGLMAQISCSFAACLHRQALISGSAGLIQTTYANHTSAPSQAVLQLLVGTDKDAVDSLVQSSAINGFLAEAESFARLVGKGPAAWTGPSPEESIDNMLTLQAILESARSGAAINLAANG